MVEFFDEVTKKNMSYHIDAHLLKRWDKLRKNRLIKKDEDRVYIVDGRERCQPKGSKVLMANGEWKNIETIKEGDEILSPQEDGTYTFSKVTKTCNWFDEETYDVIELNKNKKKLYSCSHNHLIPINYKVHPRINGNRLCKDSYWEVRHFEAQEYSKLSIKKTKKDTTTLSAFAIKDYKDRDNCEIEPYTLGVWLGDGHFSSKKEIKINPRHLCNTIVPTHYRNMKYGRIIQSKHERKINRPYLSSTFRGLGITSNNNEILDEVSKFYPIMSSYTKQGTTCLGYRFSLNGKFSKQLTKYNLEGKNSGNKFIPNSALLSDLDYRKRLLAGLIDTDGYYNKKGGYEFTLKSKKLIEGIRDLVYSIGGRCSDVKKVIKRIKKINFKGFYYRMTFYIGDIKLPLQIKRKMKSNSCFYLSPNRISIDVQKNKGKMVYGFEIDSPSRWYVTDNWMITHNSGKSVFALQQAKYLNPNFDLDNVCFTSDEFLHQIRTAEKGSVVIFDEAFRGLSSKGSQSKINKQIVQALMEMGQRNLIVFIVLPTFFLLEIYAAVLRSEALFHVYKDKNNRRAFRIYNYSKKAWLWRNGKKKGFDYSKPKVKVRGRFYGKYSINEEDYRKKKLKSLREMGEGINTIEDKYQYAFYMVVQILREKTKLSYSKMAKLINDKGYPTSMQSIGRICKDIKAKPPIPTSK